MSPHQRTSKPAASALRLTAFGLVLVVALPTLAQSPGTVKIMDLWPDGPPDDNGLSGPERAGGCVGNISKPTLTIHLPPKDKATGAAIVVTPGGGYGVVCMKTEGKDIADILIPRGIAAIVLKYRLPNGHHKIPSRDARRTIRTVRHHAAEWNIDQKRVGVWGFSAGGHLASTVSTSYDDGSVKSKDPVKRQSCRPDFSILFYPVITMEKGVTHTGSRRNLLGVEPKKQHIESYSNEGRVSNKTPPTFMLHASDDLAVPVENSLRYYQSLVSRGVSAELLIFEKGGHGPNAFNQNPSWLPTFEKWLKRRGCL